MQGLNAAFFEALKQHPALTTISLICVPFLQDAHFEVSGQYVLRMCPSNYTNRVGFFLSSRVIACVF